MQDVDLVFAQKSCFSIIYSTLRIFYIQTQKIFDTRQYNANIIEDRNIKNRLVICIPIQLLCMRSSGGLNRKTTYLQNPFLSLHLISHNQFRHSIRRAILLYSTGIENDMKSRLKILTVKDIQRLDHMYSLTPAGLPQRRPPDNRIHANRIYIAVSNLCELRVRIMFLNVIPHPSSYYLWYR